MNIEWIICPICKNKTRPKIQKDTELKNFPLYCPKCRQEMLINIQQMNMSAIKKPDAELITCSLKSAVIGSFFLKYSICADNSHCSKAHEAIEKVISGNMDALDALLKYYAGHIKYLSIYQEHIRENI